MKKNITKEEEKALLEIAKRLMAAVDSRGDLEARDNDSEDFIEVPVWGIQKAMEEAYEKVLDILCGAVADYVEQNPDLRNQPTEDMWDFKDEEEDQDDSWDEEEDDWDEEEDYEDEEDY